MEQTKNIDEKMSLAENNSIVIGVEAGKPFQLCLGEKDFPKGTIIKVRITIEPNENEVEKVPASPIPGHPDCRIGDCIECHNVSCAIHQGFEEMP